MSNICVKYEDVKHLAVKTYEEIDSCGYCWECEDGNEEGCEHPTRTEAVVIEVEGVLLNMKVNPYCKDILLIEEYDLVFCGPHEWDVCSAKLILKPALDKADIEYTHLMY